MHILLIHQAFVALDEPGGTRHHELARYLAQRGHQVTVIASTVSYLTGRADSSGVIEEDGESGGKVTVVRARTYSALHRSFVHRIFSFFSFMASSFLAGLRVRQVDLVWGTSPPIFQGVTAWLLARLKGAPFLFEVRDLWPAFAIDVGVLRSPILIAMSQWLERFLYRRADLLMINSPGFMAHVAARGARKIELIPNGADAAMFDPYSSGMGFRMAHSIEGRFVALYAGAHGMSNDLDVVLQAAALLADRPNIVIVLLGDGKEKPRLKALAEEMGLENVRFVDPVPKAEMSEALAAADACIAILKPVRLYNTVYPNKVFDYMAAGRPVILAIDGVIREVVEDAAGGVFCPPGDAAGLAAALRLLADDPARAREMGLSARRYIEERFDRPALARRLAEQMEAMLEN